MFANNIKGALSYIYPKRVSQLTLRNVFSISFSGVGSLSLDHPYMMVILIMTFNYQLYKGPKKAQKCSRCAKSSQIEFKVVVSLRSYQTLPQEQTRTWRNVQVEPQKNLAKHTREQSDTRRNSQEPRNTKNKLGRCDSYLQNLKTLPTL